MTKLSSDIVKKAMCVCVYTFHTYSLVLTSVQSEVTIANDGLCDRYVTSNLLIYSLLIKNFICGLAVNQIANARLVYLNVNHMQSLKKLTAYFISISIECMCNFQAVALR
jgi:hypothetical protein